MMSSDSSTEAPTFRAWQFFLIGALLCATAAVLLASDTSPSNLLLTSLAIAAAGGVGALTFRVLQPFAADESWRTVEQPLGARSRSALEREKTLVLRSIKELEFDRAMGKVGDVDFEEMQARLRARAMGLLRKLDERDASHYRALIERDLASRLTAKPRSGMPAVDTTVPAAAACASCGAQVEPSDAFCGACGARLRCHQCGEPADGAARFCRQCGVRLSEGQP